MEHTHLHLTEQLIKQAVRWDGADVVSAVVSSIALAHEGASCEGWRWGKGEGGRGRGESV